MKEMKFYHSKEDGSYAILLDNGALSKTDLVIVKEDERNLFSEIPEKEVPVYLRKGLRKICSLRNKRISLSNKDQELLKKKESLQLKIRAIELQMSENRVARQHCYDMCRNLSRAMSAEIIRKELSKKVTGNEVMEMSFYNGTLERELAWVVIKKTKRPLIYTHGLAYRKPTTLRKPITKLEAQKIVQQESNLLDISFNSENVHLNTFSGSDMW